MATPNINDTQKMASWVSALADQVKNPVASFLFAFDFMDKEFQKLRRGEKINFDRIDDLMVEIKGRLFSLSSYIDELSGYSKPAKISPAYHFAKSLLDDVISDLSKNPLWRGDVDIYLTDPNLEIFCDANKFKLICKSIVVNSLEAIANKSQPKIEVHLDKIDHPTSCVRICFKDNGPGIATNTLDKIGDPFYSTKEAGTGLGLSLTKRYVEAHKGEFTIKSHCELGGAEIVMTFPLPFGVAI